MATLIGMGEDIDERKDEIHRHSGWLLAVIVFVAVAAFCGLFLVYYLAPSPIALIKRHPAPTAFTDPVAAEVGGMKFVIPSNYLLFAESRRGGRQKDLALIAALPDFRGFDAPEAKLFMDHSPLSPVVNILIREETLNLPEKERLQRIYLGYVADPNGKTGPFGLTQYAFREDNGYRGEDLFVGEDRGKVVVMQCWRLTGDVANPDCLRDLRLSRDVTLSYRFKRANLGQWRRIAGGVSGLIDGFEGKAK